MLEGAVMKLCRCELDVKLKVELEHGCGGVLFFLMGVNYTAHQHNHPE